MNYWKLNLDQLWSETFLGGWGVGRGVGCHLWSRHTFAVDFPSRNLTQFSEYFCEKDPLTTLAERWGNVIIVKHVSSISIRRAYSPRKRTICQSTILKPSPRWWKEFLPTLISTSPPALLMKEKRKHSFSLFGNASMKWIGNITARGGAARVGEKNLQQWNRDTDVHEAHRLEIQAY